ncbi:condensation domain-containing protein [Aspergillus aurantiobrunneus]
MEASRARPGPARGAIIHHRYYDIQMDRRLYPTKRKSIDAERPLVDIALCTTGSEHRILICMSHAIYDGMCITSFWSTLKDLYETGRTTALSSFSRYMGQVEKSRTEEASKYWTVLLKNATLTSVGDIAPQDREFVWKAGVIGPTAVHIGESLPPGTTCATVLKSAWALVLARHTGRNDVVFADLVSGRAGTDASVADALGMCSTPIPVRALGRHL